MLPHVLRANVRHASAAPPQDANWMWLHKKGTSTNCYSGTASRRREFCHFDGTPSLCLLKRLLKGEGGAAE